ncbi:MAG: hypothetical protein QOD12_3091 [Verrucomicrobiota bacterium]|jgi:hypothetical protein
MTNMGNIRDTRDCKGCGNGLTELKTITKSNQEKI